MAGRLYIGTSGWNYAAWHDRFFIGQPRNRWLSFYATKFSAIEVNATFYRLQSAQTFRRWYQETPDLFRFAIKAHRYLTHNKKLKDPLPSIRTEQEHAAALGDKLAAVVWQLPGQFRKHLERLEIFADALRNWEEARHVIEFRHASWFDEEVAACLRRNRIAVCQSDAADWPLWNAVTTDLIYVRLHGHRLTYASSYSDTELNTWATQIQHWLDQECDVHVYFDNDAECRAPMDALRLLEKLGVNSTFSRRAG